MKWKSTLIIMGLILTSLIGGLYFMEQKQIINLLPNKLGAERLQATGTIEKNYTEESKRLTIGNETTTLLDIRLNTPIVNTPMGGLNTQLAEFTLTDFLNTTQGVFDSITYLDLNSGKEVSKNVTWKYGIDYKIEYCDNYQSRQGCVNYTNTNWTTFTSLSQLPSKSVKVGMFTNTIRGENIEWIPTISGVEIKEWAEWNITGATYDGINLSVNGQETFISGMFWKPDGSIFYIVGVDGDAVDQFNLSESWNISSAVYGQITFSVATQDTVPEGIFFKDDGTRMYISGNTNNKTYQYNLSSAWVLSTAVFSNENNFSVFNIGNPTDIVFNGTGERMYIPDRTTDLVRQYNLSVPWVLSTAVEATSETTSPEDFTNGMFFKPDGKKYFIVGNGRVVYQFSTPVPWMVNSTASYDTISYNMTGQMGALDFVSGGVTFSPDGTKMYAVSGGENTIFQYTLAPLSSPKWANNSTNSTIAGQPIIHSLNWTDDINLSGYVFSFYNGTKTGVLAMNQSNYDFTDRTNNKAYNWTGQSQLRWNVNASVLEMTSGGYDNLANQGVGSGNVSCFVTATDDYCFIRFVFTINESKNNIKWINITILGGETSDDVGAINVFNWTGNTWTNFSANLSTTYGRNTLNLSDVDLKNHIGANGNITILVDDPAVSNDIADASPIMVDYISINITYNSTIENEIFTNDTFVTFTGVQNWSNVTKYVNETIGSVIKWIVYSNDSFNNWNQTSIFQYTTTSASDTASPQWSARGVNVTSPQILDSVLFSTQWTDNTALSSYIFEWNATGALCNTMANDTAVLFNGVLNWSNVSKQIPATCLIGDVPSIAWRIYANDSTNNKNNTPHTFSFVAGASNCWINGGLAPASGVMGVIPAGCMYYKLP